jgi:antibiotic biosynthesis monooxygenase (ABM) superfamily enzyme
MLRAEEMVTAIVRSKVPEENAGAYRRETKTTSLVCSRFPGYKGMRTIEPKDVQSDWVTIYSFDSYENYNRWINSPERALRLKILHSLADAETSREQISGLDYWLAPKASSWPPSWRMTLVAFAAILPVSMFIPPLIRPLFPTLPLLGSLLAVAAVTVVMSYISLPLMVHLFRRWL